MQAFLVEETHFMSFLFAAQGIDALKDQGELQRGILSVADENQEKSFPEL